MSSRRFPPPWSVVDENAACFIVKDHVGQALAYVYFERSRLSACSVRLSYSSATLSITALVPASFTSSASLRISMANSRQ